MKTHATPALTDVRSKLLVAALALICSSGSLAAGRRYPDPSEASDRLRLPTDVGLLGIDGQPARRRDRNPDRRATR